MKEKIQIVFISLIISIVSASLIFFFIFRTVCVEGISMKPTLNNGDKIIIQKVSYYFHKPHIGDIVVVRYPSNPKELLIKRIVAKEGDTFRIDDHKIYINGSEKEEKYIYEEMNSFEDNNYRQDNIVPNNKIFVLGDNRNNSKDSRYEDIGFIDMKSIIGKATFRIYPLNKFGGIK